MNGDVLTYIFCKNDRKIVRKFDGYWLPQPICVACQYSYKKKNAIC